MNINTDLQVATPLQNTPLTNLQVAAPRSFNKKSQKKELSVNPFANLTKINKVAKQNTLTRKRHRTTNNPVVGNNNPVVGNNNPVVDPKRQRIVETVSQKMDDSMPVDEKVSQKMDVKIEAPKSEIKDDINIQMTQSRLNYNPFYKTKFKNNYKKSTNVKYNLNAFDLLTKITNEPATYLSTKTLQEYNMVEIKNNQLTAEQLDEQDEIARDLI